MAMGYSKYLNDGRQFAIDYSKREMSEVIPASALQIDGPKSWAGCNSLNRAVDFVGKFLRGEWGCVQSTNQWQLHTRQQLRRETQFVYWP
jgi:hypothetical protein